MFKDSEYEKTAKNILQVYGRMVVYTSKWIS